MKRIHLVEFEDLDWFPDWLRQCMTRLLVVMHKILGTSNELAELLVKVLPHAERPAIIDLCSGSGGPMFEVFRILKDKYQFTNLTLMLTDLYPDKETAKRVNSGLNPGITYLAKPVDATNIDPGLTGVRTMVCSMHHMKPEVARAILKDALVNRQPICVFEISDNSYPVWLWWVALPFNFVTALFLTPLARPLTWRQLVFTYLVPVIPLFFAWDGAVSNARTYTLDDMDELLKGLTAEDYHWEKGRIEGRSKKLYLLGLPLRKDEYRQAQDS
ncbi:hypothetical protein [Botryobacter ruber]|uniref:hypothetical protein n=1 Tax=Botryobacter ruber TaxID=2171629 RepID=UPI000E0B4128|nr:hypothetical protein [Botryobacter ruber]